MVSPVFVDFRPLSPPSKARCYVLCQAVGWGLVGGLGWICSGVFLSGRQPFWVPGLIVLLGLLLTHCVRPVLEHWGWKELDWNRLFPRLLAASVGLGAVWYLLGFGLVHGVWHYGDSAPRGAERLRLIGVLGCPLILFGWLGLYFLYHSAVRGRMAEIARGQLESALKETQLRALKSPLNPRFIFNSLHSLRTLADEDPARAHQAIAQLANLLRYSQPAGRPETVPFGDELRIVQDYLALEQVRHAEHLRVRLDVAEDALGRPVPPLLLQLLVENAVAYGIDPRPEGGEITISAHGEDGGLRLEVANPGPPTATDGADPAGVGLKSVAERLRLIFGANASLRLRAGTPDGVVAEVRIPPRSALA